MRKCAQLCRAGEATDDNMAHAHCMLDNLSYKHTIRIWNTYWFSTATVVAQTLLNVTLYAYWPSCSFWIHPDRLWGPLCLLRSSVQVSYVGIKRLRLVADLSLPSNNGLRNACNCASTPPYIPRINCAFWNVGTRLYFYKLREITWLVCLRVYEERLLQGVNSVKIMIMIRVIIQTL